MDPLSEVLTLLKPASYIAGAIGLDGDLSMRFPRHNGIKCYALMAGECWLVVEGIAEAVLLTAGDCFLLPRGLPFTMTTDLSLPARDYTEVLPGLKAAARANGGNMRRYMVGGFFALTGGHAEFLLKSLPPVVHIRREEDKAAMRWSLERMKQELDHPQPGSSLIAEQIACTMLVQALRLHLADGASNGVGWLFALADKQMSVAITCIHDAPGSGWTLQQLAERVGMSRSVFAERFKEKVGLAPMEYLTKWRMMLAGDRLKGGGEAISAIASSLGYESDSAFGKAFKRVMGCSPRQYSRPQGEVLHGAGEATGSAEAALEPQAGAGSYAIGHRLHEPSARFFVTHPTSR